MKAPYQIQSDCTYVTMPKPLITWITDISELILFLVVDKGLKYVVYIASNLCWLFSSVYKVHDNKSSVTEKYTVFFQSKLVSTFPHL